MILSQDTVYLSNNNIYRMATYTPFLDDSYKKFEDDVKSRGGMLCTGVLDSDGTFHIQGDSDMMVREIGKLKTIIRRSSLEWVPSDDPLPKLPMPLKELFLTLNRNLVKKTSSAFIRYFLKDDQQIGKVIVSKIGKNLKKKIKKKKI